MAAKNDTVWLRTRQSLLDRVSAGDCEKSAAEFYSMYWRAVYGYVLRVGIGAADAPDVVQEVFIKIFRRLPAFEYSRKKGRFLSWVKTVSRSTALDFFRRRKCRLEGKMVRKMGEDGRDNIEDLPDSLGSMVADPWEQEWESSLLATALERIKDRVKPQTFEAFRMYALQDQPVDRVATALSITPNTVYIAKNRVVALLKDEVNHLCEELQ